MRWGAKQLIVMASAAGLLAGGGVAKADPVSVTDTTNQYRQTVACARWTHPVGFDDVGNPTTWRVTEVCSYAIDQNGDGVLEHRGAGVSKKLCSGPDAALCDGEGVGQGLTADEAAIDFDAGTASVHADVAGCRVDLDWTATGGISGYRGDEPTTIEGTSASPLHTELHTRESSQEQRAASVSGEVCAWADASGTPTAELQRSGFDHRKRSVTVDPTA